MPIKLIQSTLGLVIVLSSFIFKPLPLRADQTGLASWYGPGLAGKTASGEWFNPNDLTAAHPDLPFGAEVRVTNVNNGRSVVVRINDRMGDSDRIIDLSTAAAQVLDLVDAGIAPVQLQVLTP